MNQIIWKAYHRLLNHCAEEYTLQAALTPENTELVICLRNDEDCFRHGYYLPSWEKRCVFFGSEKLTMT